MSTRETFLATCSLGLERVLLDEVRALKLAKAEGQPGGVSFTGTMADAWTANLMLRTASRVLLRLDRFQAPVETALYEGARRIDWDRFITPDGTFLVHARSNRSAIENTIFASQRVKDGVADTFRDRHGRRPNVDKKDPELRIHVHLANDRATILADTTGEPLFKRGWREFQGRAPLKETVAAACLAASGWDRRAPLLDPFCGSGTILIEGARMAAGNPPGADRTFMFERWTGHDARAYAALREKVRTGGTVPKKLALWGGDIDAEAVAGAAGNARAAGLGDRISFEVADVAEFAPPKGWNAFIVTNPPYGQRVGAGGDLKKLYRTFGEVLTRHCAGYRVALLHEDPALFKATGMKADQTLELKNGPIDCRLAIFTVRG